MENTKKTILVVEDERPLLEVIKQKLEKNDIDVVTARSAEQAYNYASDGVKVDAIWLDHYILGTETGLDFLAKLRSSPHKDIPVFVVSNTASDDKQRSYMRLGAVKYYVKANNTLATIISDIKSYLADPQE